MTYAQSGEAERYGDAIQCYSASIQAYAFYNQQAATGQGKNSGELSQSYFRKATGFLDRAKTIGQAMGKDGAGIAADMEAEKQRRLQLSRDAVAQGRLAQFHEEMFAAIEKCARRWAA
jgi:hypothetical protein